MISINEILHRTLTVVENIAATHSHWNGNMTMDAAVQEIRTLKDIVLNQPEDTAVDNSVEMTK